MKAPFPYFGGKSSVAAEIWRRFGSVPNYIEPFFGSGAVLLSRPDSHQWWEHIETVNDADGMIANFWRAVQAAPDAVARWADWPVNENDLHARHRWLIGQRDRLQVSLEGDATYYDAKVAGWWLWGICQWIGSGWCSATSRQRPNLSDSGMGIHQKRPHLSRAGMGLCNVWSEHLRTMMAALQDRLRRVRVCSGDWSRICGDTPTVHAASPVGVFLDPPYDQSMRDTGLYSHESDISTDVREWAIERGDDTRYRIALCGYFGEHEMPESWTAYRWKAQGGYGTQGQGRGRSNSDREVIWFSPHCECVDRGSQLSLFEG